MFLARQDGNAGRKFGLHALDSEHDVTQHTRLGNQLRLGQLRVEPRGGFPGGVLSDLLNNSGLSNVLTHGLGAAVVQLCLWCQLHR